MLVGPLQSDAVAAFKQQLGIGPAEDPDFGWIAEVGLQSPLPPRWTSHTDSESNFVYYVDHDRQTSCWENPLVPWLRQVVEIGRAYLQNPTETFFEEQKGLLWHQHKHDLDLWHGPFTDDEGRKYYVNAQEGVSSWQDPRVEAQYVFELESGLLTSLEEVLPPPPRGECGPEDDPWFTTGGAEVLTLEGSSNGFAGSKRANRPKTGSMLLTQATMKAKEEHKSTLDKMSSTADRLNDMRQEDVEAQRLQLVKKVEARKNKKKMAAIGESRIPQQVSQPQVDSEAINDSHSNAVSSPSLRGRATPKALDLADDPKPPACDRSLPPPPPPPGECSRPVSPVSPSRGSQADLFRPPAQLPSPLAGQRPVMPTDVEQMLRRSPKASVNSVAWEDKASALGSLELRYLPSTDEEPGVVGKAALASTLTTIG